MTRPSRNQDQLLIEAGKKLLPELGVSGMSLQKVAREAGINLGMFNYHFKTKANFVRQVLDALKQDSLTAVEFETPKNATSIERLRIFLFSKGKIFRDQSNLIFAMFRDFLNLDPVVSELVLTDNGKQSEVLKRMIKECQKDGYVDRTLSVDQIDSFCISSIREPIVFTAALNRIKNGKKKISSKVTAHQLSDDAISEIVDMVIRGIAPKSKKK